MSAQDKRVDSTFQVGFATQLTGNQPTNDDVIAAYNSALNTFTAHKRAVAMVEVRVYAKPKARHV